MTRTLVLTPLFIAAAMSAQVPATPPRAPLPQPASPRVDVNSYFDLNDQISLNLDLARAQDGLAREYAFEARNYALSDLQVASAFAGWGPAGPVAWARQDPADSLYRVARDQFNRGDYRKAAELFKSLPEKFANSAYVPDAQYYQAFSLYRIGGTAELQQALAVLEARKPSANDNSRRAGRTIARSQVMDSMSRDSMSRVIADRLRADARARDASRAVIVDVPTVTARPFRPEVDVAGLAARIATVLSSRGLANDPAVKRALAAGGNTCDVEDQSVRAEALSALMQNDPETGRQMAAKILASKDDCSAPLRRDAVMLVGNRHDDAAAALLVSVAKTDPSPVVRISAIDYLVRLQTDAAISAVIDLARANDDTQVQRAAVRALAQSSNVRARAEVRSIAENPAVDEGIRMSVLDGLDPNQLTPDDAAWLRALYGKTTSAMIKARIVAALARGGGDVNNQWLLALLRNEDEPVESRAMAIERIGPTMDLATLERMYDASPQRTIRAAVVTLLAGRQEPAALDKIVDIARNGTDPAMRRLAINALSRSKDPRATKLLLELVDH